MMVAKRSPGRNQGSTSPRAADSGYFADTEGSTPPRGSQELSRPKTLKDEARQIPTPQVARALGLKVAGNGNAKRVECPNPRGGHRGDCDKHPSASCWLHDGVWRWKCQTCGKTGDSIDLVQQCRAYSFLDALMWLQTTFPLVGELHDAPVDPIEQWASIRGLNADSVRSFGVEVTNGYLRFPMSSGVGQAIVGYQMRRVDNRAITTDGKRSVLESGVQGLFVPQDWPKPDASSALLICEGESDAIAAHSAQIPHVVGTPGRVWPEEAERGLKILRRGWPGRVILIVDGDVRDSKLLEGAYMIEAEVLRVPLFVSPTPRKRDLNEWLLQSGGADQIRKAVLTYAPYTPLFRNATDQVIEAVRRTGTLQQRHIAPLTTMVTETLLQVLPFGKDREMRAVKVGPGEFLWTWRRLADLAGVSVRTARTLGAKLERAGFWIIEGKDAKGVLMKVGNLSAFRKVGAKDWETGELQVQGLAPDRGKVTLFTQAATSPSAKDFRKGS